MVVTVGDYTDLHCWVLPHCDRRASAIKRDAPLACGQREPDARHIPPVESPLAASEAVPRYAALAFSCVRLPRNVVSPAHS